jgi:hypothetical protein
MRRHGSLASPFAAGDALTMAEAAPAPFVTIARIIATAPGIGARAIAQRRFAPARCAK